MNFIWEHAEFIRYDAFNKVVPNESPTIEIMKISDIWKQST